MTIFLLGFLSAVLTGTGLAFSAMIARPAFFRRILQHLWALSHSFEAGHVTYHLRRRDNLAPRVPQSAQPVGQNAPVQAISADVISALINLGVGRKKAELAVRQAIESHTPIAFEPLFHRAVEIARAA